MAGRSILNLRPYQEESKNAVFDEWNKVNRTLLVLPTGCHHPDQGILMMDGTVTKAKDIREGDYLMGPDGQPRTVLKLHHGIDEMYEVTPVKGKPFIVNSEHILPMVKTCESGDRRYPSQKGGRVDLVKTSEWEKKSKTWRHVHKLFRSPCITKFWGYRDIYINPYFLGILLGDGEIKYGVINITTPDPEVIDHIYEQAEVWNMTVDIRPAGKAKTYYFKSGKTGVKGSSLHNALKEYGLIGKGSGEKFVPYEYKTAFEEARKELLAGLLDSDGCISCNGYDFVSKSKRLAEDVVFISRSLGLAAYLTKTQKSIKKIGFTGTYWRVSISGNTSIIPCRAARKQCHKRKQSKDVLRTGIRSIEPIGRGEYFGFTVDGDNLYLMDDFTVTHNCGKTIVFAKITEDCVRQGKRVLILAHRGELLDQAADKLEKSTGLKCSVEKAEQTCLDSWYRVTVGSVQSLQREARLEKFNSHYFDVIIVDEAHHAVSDSYQRVLHHFDEAKVLGVTATPDRSDLRNLGSYFESLAYEYTLPRAIKEGYLCPIKALTIPLKLDISDVGISSGDFKAGEIGSALDPYLEQIADEMTSYCKDRKTVVFLPLIATSQKFRDILISKGFRAGEVNGESKDRAQVLEDFEAGKYDVLCNSMLLTEGWDCPSVDCIVVLRPTKVRGLYCLDEKTEVLTRDGWKSDVEVGEDVLAFDANTGKTRFVPALAKVRRKLEPDEYFCSIKGQSTDIRVTNHHRILYDNKRHRGWKFKEAQDIARLKDGVYLPVSGQGEFAGVPLTDAELTFIGWVMTDGSINLANNQITITQGENHEEYCEEIERCIIDCGFKFNRIVRRRTIEETHYNAHGNLVLWTISKGKPRGRDKHLTGWERLEPWLSKDLSPMLFDMTERQFVVMLNAIYHGDGNKFWKTTYHIGKGNKTFIERLQIMAIQRGYRASVSLEKNNEVRKSDLWYLHIKKQNFVKVGSASANHSRWREEEHTDETCWCVQTELGTIVTRRNGRVAIVGNCQMVGRGTRLSPGKDHLLLLDFLWMTEKHELCRPASLICETEEVAKAMTRKLEENAGEEFDLEEAEKMASESVVEQREAALAAKLAEMRRRKRQLVDPLQFEMSIQDEDLVNYVPAFGWEIGPPTDKQKATLEKLGIMPDEIETAGKAAKILDRLDKRRNEGLTTPKQIRFLERNGFRHVGTWQFEDAKRLIDRIASNGWRVPRGINPETYEPAPRQMEFSDFIG